jgi:anthranilate/para-aminobenzoate synthase component II
MPRTARKGGYGVGTQGLTNPFEAARYHSLVIDRKGFPDDALEVTAWTDDGTIMAVRHRQFPHIQVRPPLCFSY